MAPASAPANAGSADPQVVFRELIQACNTWNQQVGNRAPGELSFDGGPTDPSRAITEISRPSPGKVLLQDAEGSRLLLDLAARTVSAEAGDTVPLPIRYSYCPSEIFLGPHHD